jgi:hypothetical protein
MSKTHYTFASHGKIEAGSNRDPPFKDALLLLQGTPAKILAEQPIEIFIVGAEEFHQSGTCGVRQNSRRARIPLFNDERFHWRNAEKAVNPFRYTLWIPEEFSGIDNEDALLAKFGKEHAKKRGIDAVLQISRAHAGKGWDSNSTCADRFLFGFNNGFEIRDPFPERIHDFMADRSLLIPPPMRKYPLDRIAENNHHRRFGNIDLARNIQRRLGIMGVQYPVIAPPFSRWAARCALCDGKYAISSRIVAGNEISFASGSTICGC